MRSIRKYYIRKREKKLGTEQIKSPRLIFNKDTPSTLDWRESPVLPTKQKFPNYFGARLDTGGITLVSKVQVYNTLGLYLQKKPLNLMAIQIDNKWYTGALVAKARFERPMEQLLFLLLSKRHMLRGGQ